jgi:hypothetical protein
MRTFDPVWIGRLDSPLIALERAALIRSYAALLAVVHRSSR